MKTFWSLCIVLVLSGATLAAEPQQVALEELVDHPEKYTGKTIVVKGDAKRNQTDDENQKLFLLYGDKYFVGNPFDPPRILPDRTFNVLIEGLEDFSQDFHNHRIDIVGVVGEPTAPPTNWGFKGARLVTVRKAKILTEISELDLYGNFDLKFLVAYPTKLFGKEVKPDRYVGEKIQVEGWVDRLGAPEPSGKLFLIHGEYDKNKKILVEGIEKFPQALYGKHIVLGGIVSEPTEPPKNWGFDKKLPVIRKARILSE